MAERQTGDLLASRYRIVRRLGRGGMGVVYLATQEPLAREVAVKVIRGDDDVTPEQLHRLRREAESIASIRHRNVVTLLDYSEVGAELFLVMEVVSGGTLGERMAIGEPMPWREAAGYLLEIAAGLSAAHARGIAHRDLKPGNVMIALEDDGTEVVKIVDFGLALPSSGESEERLTETGRFLGTPAYMAPEMATPGETPGPPADLYALGVVAFELLTGTLPFDDPNPLALALAHTRDPTPSLLEVAPDVEIPDELRSLVTDLLDKEQRSRPTASAARERLEALLGIESTRRSSSELRRSDSDLSGDQHGATESMSMALHTPPLPSTPADPSTLQPATVPKAATRPPIAAWAAVFLLVVALLGGVLVLRSRPQAAPNPSPTAVVEIDEPPDVAAPQETTAAEVRAWRNAEAERIVHPLVGERAAGFALPVRQASAGEDAPAAWGATAWLSESEREERLLALRFARGGSRPEELLALSSSLGSLDSRSALAIVTADDAPDGARVPTSVFGASGRAFWLNDALQVVGPSYNAAQTVFVRGDGVVLAAYDDADVPWPAEVARLASVSALSFGLSSAKFRDVKSLLDDVRTSGGVVTHWYEFKSPQLRAVVWLDDEQQRGALRAALQVRADAAGLVLHVVDGSRFSQWANGH